MGSASLFRRAARFALFSIVALAAGSAFSQSHLRSITINDLSVLRSLSGQWTVSYCKDCCMSHHPMVSGAATLKTNNYGGWDNDYYYNCQGGVGSGSGMATIWKPGSRDDNGYGPGWASLLQGIETRSGLEIRIFDSRGHRMTLFRSGMRLPSSGRARPARSNPPSAGRVGQQGDVGAQAVAQCSSRPRRKFHDDRAKCQSVGGDGRGETKYQCCCEACGKHIYTQNIYYACNAACSRAFFE